ARLARAVELYRGDLLTGFHLSDAEPFEDWLVAEQERLREGALRALRTLTAHFGTRGEYDAALAHGRRLVEMDPLSEEGHREVMRLYVLAGRRRRALSHYEEMAGLLGRELGAEPLPETRSLYELILADSLPAGGAAQLARPPLGPLVPLTGRGEALAALDASWNRALGEGPRLTLVLGEAGVGTTRLVRTFLDTISSQHRATIVQAVCAAAPRRAGEPFVDVLQALVERDVVAPHAAEPARRAQSGDGDLGDRLLATLAAFFATDLEAPRPLVVFLDGVEALSAGAAGLLARVLDPLAGQPLWIVAAGAGSGAGATTVQRLLEHPRVDRVQIHRVEDAEIAEIARALLGDDGDVAALAEHLAVVSEGLPLAVVEAINALTDAGVLVAAAPRRWSLEAPPQRTTATRASLERMILDRVARLPTSARRLLTLAAVIGRVFDVELLQRVEREHIGVIEIGLELMLERWLIRQHARRWSDDPRERDLVLWAQGARRGSFEFAHPLLRETIYRALDPRRRRSLHGEVAEVLAGREDLGAAAAETVAHHWWQAGEWERALPHLEAAAARAAELGDSDTERFYRQRVAEAAGRRDGAGPGPDAQTAATD
ncbi:MAG TPA: BTAD domain-containing putative transcriptional regulator, partial [Thermoanaerobaculia bacterium]|nr:BTAD domain-containing putative transcriptional regulator [Thermoanaerobaculia bacterium]